jgi:alkanesulfonate monooxygenase
MPLRFHWSLSSAGESRRGARARAEQSGLPPFDLYLDFCRQAERSGIESLLMAFGFHRADPVALSAALGAATERIVFLVAMRAGVVSPTYFVQQVNTVAALTGGRIAINIVAGHTPREHGYYGDFLDHDQRYERLDEFWTVCHALWDGGEVDFAGRHYRIEGGRLRTPYVGADKKDWATFLHFIYTCYSLPITNYLITHLFVTDNFSACREYLADNRLSFPSAPRWVRQSYLSNGL